MTRFHGNKHVRLGHWFTLEIKRELFIERITD